jgi:hypothetical protein
MKNGKSWLIQTVAWIRVIDGVRPELDAVQAWCKSAADIPIMPGEDTMSVKAEVKVLWTEYRDRGINQDTLVWAECDATPLLRAHFEMSDALPSSFTQEQASQLPSISLDFAFEHKLGSGAQLETSTSGPVNDFSLWYTATDIKTEIHKPLEKVEQTACLSPAFYDEMPLLKWLEWREHMRRIGTERVAWYGRQPNLGTFVDAYNKLAGAKDVFRRVQIIFLNIEYADIALTTDMHPL